MNVVLDTNVLVSALLSPFRPPGRILDLVLAGDLAVAYDDRVLGEYRQVLARARFAFDPRAVEDLLFYVECAGQAVVAPPLDLHLPDPDDRIFLEVAAAARAILVSGNLRHFPPAQRQTVVVLAPSAFLEHWQNRPG